MVALSNRCHQANSTGSCRPTDPPRGRLSCHLTNVYRWLLDRGGNIGPLWCDFGGSEPRDFCSTGAPSTPAVPNPAPTTAPTAPESDGPIRADARQGSSFSTSSGRTAPPSGRFESVSSRLRSAQALRNASRSALTCSANVVHIPCGAPGRPLRLPSPCSRTSPERPAEPCFNRRTVPPDIAPDVVASLTLSDSTRVARSSA